MHSDREELIREDLETNWVWKLGKRDHPGMPLRFLAWATAIFPGHCPASAQSRESQDHMQFLQPQETVLLGPLFSRASTEDPVS